jgi:hypothetical protein
MPRIKPDDYAYLALLPLSCLPGIPRHLRRPGPMANPGNESLVRVRLTVGLYPIEKPPYTS